ncbi:hypothetical protein K458DRAFT_343980 [Lentithecium fluviatile CBS 122367]|uniref:Mid2 domain-containing protein n=1 Tax=Lentithecium fluviatile CBS 122367 TaxID=1168545 RepID=A0A6G1IT91_9PLEO|nr:hypothetical protein K458DRAFT_343980 [Lentithecium fluviatile CBS 122367]
MYSLIGFAGVFALVSRTVAADCYFPNGDVVASDTACNPNALVSACCYDGQACLSNGLCVSDPHNETLARFHRGTCTDKAWKSGNCPRECLDIDNDGVPVYSCNTTGTDSYCCYDNCECNNFGFETFSFSDTDVYTVTIIGESFTQTHTSSSLTATSSTSASTTTSGASASTTNTTNVAATGTGTSSPSSTVSTSDSSSSKSTAIGAGIGGGVGAALLIGAASFFWRRKKRSNDAQDTMYAGSAGKPAEMYSPRAEYYPPLEKYSQYADSSVFSGQSGQQVAEMSSEQTAPVELPISSRGAPSPKVGV